MEGMGNHGNNHSSHREAVASVRIGHDAPLISNLKTSLLLQVLKTAHDAPLAHPPVASIFALFPPVLPPS